MYRRTYPVRLRDTGKTLGHAPYPFGEKSIVIDGQRVDFVNADHWLVASEVDCTALTAAVMRRNEAWEIATERAIGRMKRNSDS